MTRQTKNNSETLEEKTLTSKDMETKEANFKLLVRKLACFNRSTSDVFFSGSEKINQQYALLKNKLDEASDLMQKIQGLKIDAEENDEAKGTRERKTELQPYETAIERLDERRNYDESKRKEQAL